MVNRTDQNEGGRYEEQRKRMEKARMARRMEGGRTGARGRSSETLVGERGLGRLFQCMARMREELLTEKKETEKER